MTIGKDMVSNLEQNKSLDFHFVSEEEGKKGLEDGDYYMVVTLPSDLSEKAASILSDHPEQMNINYQTSSGHSFIASKMSDSAMTQLKQNVSANVTETYTKALFQKMGDLKSGLTKAADGSEQLAKSLPYSNRHSLVLFFLLPHLENNKSLDFHFVNEEEGKIGLENGDLEMVGWVGTGVWF